MTRSPLQQLISLPIPDRRAGGRTTESTRAEYERAIKAYEQMVAEQVSLTMNKHLARRQAIAAEHNLATNALGNIRRLAHLARDGALTEDEATALAAGELSMATAVERHRKPNR